MLSKATNQESGEVFECWCVFRSVAFRRAKPRASILVLALVTNNAYDHVACNSLLRISVLMMDVRINWNYTV